MSARVLVAYGSKMGGTAEIAQAIARELRAHGAEVDVQRARDVRSLDPYPYVVLGSAIYLGRWRREAMKLLAGRQRELLKRRVWLFQSGLEVTDPHGWTEPTPDAVRTIAEAIGTGLPVTFAGRITRETARGIIPRIMARGTQAGDFRDWERIRLWAADVALQVQAAHPGLHLHGI